MKFRLRIDAKDDQLLIVSPEGPKKSIHFANVNAKVVVRSREGAKLVIDSSQGDLIESIEVWEQ